MRKEDSYVELLATGLLHYLCFYRTRKFTHVSLLLRYMPSGYTYNVANCELSPFYLTNFEDTTRHKYDFVDDYDYDFFQREPHCKTTSSIGNHFGGKNCMCIGYQ